MLSVPPWSWVPALLVLGACTDSFRPSSSDHPIDAATAIEGDVADSGIHTDAGRTVSLPDLPPRTEGELPMCIERQAALGWLVLPDNYTQRARGTSSIGKGCEDNFDCMIPEICLTVPSCGLFGGAPPGTCTIDCAGYEGLCRHYDSVTRCMTTGKGGDLREQEEPAPVAYCMRDTSEGGPCLDTDTHYTYPGDTDGGQYFCMPRCYDDSQCHGWECDTGVGVCVPTAPAGAPMGTLCDLDAPDPCEGHCSWYSNSCSTHCEEDTDCLQDGEQAGVCFHEYHGYCDPFCTTDADCAEGRVCKGDKYLADSGYPDKKLCMLQ